MCYEPYWKPITRKIILFCFVLTTKPHLFIPMGFLVYFCLAMITNEIYSLFLKSGKVSTDTRKNVSGSLFFCLKGDNFNGNEFAEKAFELGASYVITDEPEYKLNDRTFTVPDTLSCLQELAILHREKLSLPVLAITGSNGKTTSKELINAVLSKKFNTLATSGNLNNHIGVPLTILSVKPEHTFAIIEMGANHQGEIEKLCHIANPTYGLITNIGKAHLEGFGGLEGVVKAKTELYRYIQNNNGLVFVNGNNHILMNLSEGLLREIYGNTKTIFSEIADYDQYLKVNWHYNQKIIQISTKLFGSYNLENIMAAISIGLFFGVNEVDIAEAIEGYKPQNHRSQIIKGLNNNIIADLYNANPSSMLAGIQEFIRIPGNNKILILGDMLELGAYTHTEHQKIIDYLTGQQIKDVYLVGTNFKKASSGSGYQAFDQVEKLKEWIAIYPLKGKTIYLKGSRGTHLEELLTSL